MAASIAKARLRLRSGSAASSGSGGSPQQQRKEEHEEEEEEKAVTLPPKPPIGIVKPSDLRKRKEQQESQPEVTTKSRPPLHSKPPVVNKPPPAPKSNRIASLMKGFEQKDAVSQASPSLLSLRSPERKPIELNKSPQTGRRMGGTRQSVNDLKQRYAHDSSESTEEGSGSGTVSPTQRTPRHMSPASDDERPSLPARPGPSTGGAPAVFHRSLPEDSSPHAGQPSLPPRQPPSPPALEPERITEEPPSPLKRKDSKPFVYTPFSKRSSIVKDDDAEPELSPPPPSLPDKPQQTQGPGYPPHTPSSPSSSNTFSHPPPLPPTLPSRQPPSLPPSLPERPPPSLPERSPPSLPPHPG